MRLARSAFATFLVLLLTAPAQGASVRRADDHPLTTPTSTTPATVTVQAVPTPPTVPAAEPPEDTAYADPSRALGATSPSCNYALDTRLRRSCRASGSPAQPHPLSAYGIDVRSGFSITDPGKTFMSALQSIGAGIWMGLLYAIKGVLLLLEWAFSLDLTGKAMPEASRTLARLHGQVFGEPWLMLAISLTGVWGIWRGLVQRRTVETFTGLAATVAMFVVALVVIAQPGPTVGRAAQLANGAGMEILAAGSGEPPGRSRNALGSSLARVFDQTVRNPWCALEFGSVDYCDEPAGGSGRSSADLWLSYPAQSWQRDRLHTAMKPKKDDGFSIIGGAKDILGLTDDRELSKDVQKQVVKAPERAKMQEAGGTFPRLALLGTVAVGLLGAITLLAYIGVRLLLASAMTLLLLLMAPAMLIAPALGDGGRAAFIAWGKRLLGAILAKLVYSIFLTIVLATGQVFTHLDIGWFGTWLLLGAFWWGVFLKRNELIEFVAAGAPRSQGAGVGQALSQGYYAWMLGRGARQIAGATVSPATTAMAASNTHRAERREAMALATQDLARERLDADGRRVLTNEQDQARATVHTRDQLRDELRATDQRLRGFDESSVAARATDAPAPVPSEEQRGLLEHRRRLQELLAHPAASEAEQTVRHADRNRALTGAPVTQRDLDAYRARRARELRETDDPADERHQRAAGMEPGAMRGGDADRRQAFEQQVRDHLTAERELHDAAEDPRPRSAPAQLDKQELSRRAEEHRRRLHQERRQRRAQRGIYRR